MPKRRKNAEISRAAKCANRAQEGFGDLEGAGASKQKLGVLSRRNCVPGHNQKNDTRNGLNGSGHPVDRTGMVLQ
jgi:hypothetical protein